MVKQEEIKPGEQKITLIAVGDIMLGDSFYTPGFGVGSTIKKKGPEYPFKNTASITGKGDVVIGNLEAVLSSDAVNLSGKKSMVMRADPGAVGGLKFAGFNVLSLANNHILEYGATGLSNTTSVLNENHIAYSGLNYDYSCRQIPTVINKKNISLSLLAYCLIKDRTAFSGSGEPEKMYEDVRKAKNNSDLVIVSIHWGDEYIDYPSSRQIETAHRLVDAGATLVLGHHPHVLQGIESYGGGLIAYSLGNFIFDSNFIKKTRQSVILECLLSEKGLLSYLLHPVYVNQHYSPQLLEGDSKRRAVEHLGALSAIVSDPERHTEAEYENAVSRQRAEARKKMKRQFVGNLYRYPAGYSFQTITGYLRKTIR